MNDFLAHILVVDDDGPVVAATGLPPERVGFACLRSCLKLTLNTNSLEKLYPTNEKALGTRQLGRLTVVSIRASHDGTLTVTRCRCADPHLSE